MLKLKECVKCGCQFNSNHGNNVLCPECALNNIYKTQHRYNKKRKSKSKCSCMDCAAYKMETLKIEIEIKYPEQLKKFFQMVAE